MLSTHCHSELLSRTAPVVFMRPVELECASRHISSPPADPALHARNAAFTRPQPLRPADDELDVEGVRVQGQLLGLLVRQAWPILQVRQNAGGALFEFGDGMRFSDHVLTVTATPGPQPRASELAYGITLATIRCRRTPYPVPCLSVVLLSTITVTVPLPTCMLQQLVLQLGLQ